MEWVMAPRLELSQADLFTAQALLSGLTELSSRASHDLLGPLNQAASLLALFIRRYRNQLGPDADNLLELLHSSSTRMESVTAGVRRYMEVASHPPCFGPVDLNASLASSLALLDKAVSESGAVIVSDSLPVVSADATHMATIFEILIGNSIKFRKPDVPPRIQVSLRGTAGIWSIAIADNGIGIGPEYSEAVFLPFKRLNGRAYTGAGLGLATAKLILEMHGGGIRIGSSQESVGTSVQFTLRPEQP
jgi:light-regulated signal transduction histidine kinase (bacteriophytochrome)